MTQNGLKWILNITFKTVKSFWLKGSLQKVAFEAILNHFGNTIFWVKMGGAYLTIFQQFVDLENF